MSHKRRAVTSTEVAFTVACIVAVLACVLPSIAHTRGVAGVEQSLSNLLQLGATHAVYAADWNGRQVTFIKDEMASYGDSLTSAFSNYTNSQGGYGDPDNWHPAVTLGWGLINGDGDPAFFAYRCNGNMANASLTVPINFNGGVQYFGSFRLINARPLHNYISGRFYDQTFYAPQDSIVQPLVEPLFDSPWEFVDMPPLPGVGDLPIWSSYIMSPAAMFNPDVMRSPARGGFQDPWSFDEGMASPSLTQARYPAFKTLMLEHHWLQNTPANPCNPFFDGSYDGCEPYYFNHSITSAPAALFYDLSVSLLHNSAVSKADQQMIERVGYGLWSRDTSFGTNGYFNNASYDEVDLSHHILTTDGILGRDCLSR